MNQVNIKVKIRETGKHDAKKFRAEGLVPGVFYSKGTEPISILADPLSLRPIVYTAERKTVALEIEGMDGTKDCILKDIQFDPVSDKIVHFDLYGFIQGQKMTLEVPVVLKGASVGVRDGGIIQHLIHKTSIHCLPKDLPTSIELDITNLKIGESILVRNIQLEGIEFSLPQDTAFVSIVAPRVSTTDKPGEK